MAAYAHTDQDPHVYGWPPIFCQPAYTKLIMLIELDHGVMREEDY